MSIMRYLISGGGTGGHIFPAISIANALKELDKNAEILFVGAQDRMEMERVPQAGYEIIGLPVSGLDRQHIFRNIKVVGNLLWSLHLARAIVRRFKPDIGIGVGGYASGAAMKAVASAGIPIVLQEQNGFAGVTNKLLKNNASAICVAFEGMEKFFPKEKIILTGNPVRQDLEGGDRGEAATYFSLVPDKPTLLILGGSLGARTINESLLAHLDDLLSADIQVIWQTGKAYIEHCQEVIRERYKDARTVGGAFRVGNVRGMAFVSRMDLAYAMADVVVSRAGASSISELCLLGKPSVLVPSPNVTEDHQTHNAMALVNKDAAVMIRDWDAEEQLVGEALLLLGDKGKRELLSQNALKLAQRDSAKRIAQKVMEIASIHRLETRV
ncbi:MAG: undecaprenyldiphospho-muramoylpentapeptide beta-N-acetylglucosaminyltransferase [Paludibacteraceae bacterium]|nr:undecaprenyldiphospho-muramoylpentapeptide beta-N-acetylglucosaminyltransferase [Paludibacteraceae bacterium]